MASLVNSTKHERINTCPSQTLTKTEEEGTLQIHCTSPVVP